MRLAAVTLVRDSEKFIVPHLQMYTGVDRNVVLFIPQVLVGGASGHATVRDSSLNLIKTHCPDVEIFQTTTNVWGAPLFNEALELVKECDKVVLLHADVVLSQKHWRWLRTLLLETDFDVYRLDMSKCTIDYYHDFTHGVRDCIDNEPIAVKTDVRFRKFYDTEGEKTTFTIDNPSFEVHHFNGWKGVFMTDDWFLGKVPSESGIFIHDLIPKGGWLTCPKDIQTLFHENSPRP